MPKHRSRSIEVEVDGKLEKLPDFEAERASNIETVHIPMSHDDDVKVQLQIDATLKITGKYSGRNYLFSGAGSVQDVDTKDVEWLLERRQGGRQCCGGAATGNVVFKLAGE